MIDLKYAPYRHIHRHRTAPSSQIRKHICIKTTNNSLWCSSHSTTDYPKYEEGGPTGRESTAQRAKPEDSKCPKYNGFPSDSFAEWAKDERSNTVSNQKDGGWKNLLAAAWQVEILHDSGDCIARQGRGNSTIKHDEECNNSIVDLFILFKTFVSMMEWFDLVVYHRNSSSVQEASCLDSLLNPQWIRQVFFGLVD